ncbi:MAG: hypothetical protein KA230_05725 [Flavobacteriales bacterium]|nr:hypothetical protein [Flavobacteriales bacterium]
MKTSLLIGSLLTFTPIAHAQWQTMVSREDIDLKVEVDSVPFEESEGVYLETLSVDVFKGDRFLQRIIPPANCTWDRFFPWPKVLMIEDVNFDGLEDIRLLSWHSIEFYPTYWYWMFNADSKSFERDSTMDEIVNPTFDHGDSVVHSWWREGVTVFGNEEYEFDEEGKLILVWSEVVGMMPGEDYALLVRTTLNNGELREEEIQLSEEEMEQYTGRRRRPR